MPTPEQPNIEVETKQEVVTPPVEQPAEVEQRQEIHGVERETSRDTEQVSHSLDEAKAEEIVQKIEGEGATVEKETPATTDATPEQTEKPAEKDLVTTLKTESESFMNKFNKAKGMEKVGVLMEKFGELTEKVRDALLTIGRPMLLQMANWAEQFGLLSKPLIDQLRNIASSEQAILQEMLKEKNFVLVRDINKKNDTTALGTLRKKYTAKAEEAKKAPKSAESAEALAASDKAAPDAAPATAPVETPPKPEAYTFEDYVTNIVKEAVSSHDWSQKTANKEGLKQLTLTEIVSILPA